MNKLNWSIIGHQKIVEYLTQSIKSKNISHAYLFSGPSHIGKSALAFSLAKTLNCEKKDLVFCNKCLSCEQIDKGSSPDIIIFKNDNQNIKIEEIRELQHKLSLKNFSSSYKIAIIEDAERMTEEAANCLLKTLEEPPSKTIIILTTSFVTSLLPTIISRCQMINIHLVAIKEIEDWLKKLGAGNREANYLSYLSGGRPGIAFETFENPDKLSWQMELLEEFIKLRNQNIIVRFNFVSKLLKQEENINNVLDFWILFMRDLLLFKENCSDIVSNSAFKKEFDAWNKEYSISKIRLLLNEISKTKEKISLNVNPKLSLEYLMLQI